MLVVMIMLNIVIFVLLSVVDGVDVMIVLIFGISVMMYISMLLIVMI